MHTESTRIPGKRARVNVTIDGDAPTRTFGEDEIRWIIGNSALSEMLDYAFDMKHPVILCIGLKSPDGDYVGSMLVSVGQVDAPCTRINAASPAGNTVAINGPDEQPDGDYTFDIYRNADGDPMASDLILAPEYGGILWQSCLELAATDPCGRWRELMQGRRAVPQSSTQLESLRGSTTKNPIRRPVATECNATTFLSPPTCNSDANKNCPEDLVCGLGGQRCAMDATPGVEGI